MNKANHKALGRYCYGGKIYTGLCDKCGKEHLMTIDQVQEVISNSYLKPKSNVQKFKSRIELFQRAFNTLLFSFMFISLANFVIDSYDVVDFLVV